MHNLKSLRGFSLIEVAVVIGILAIMAAVALPSFFQGHNQADLNGTTSQIATSLRTAQSQAVSQVKASSWGIHFSNPVPFGTYLSQFGSFGTSTGQFYYPEGIAVDSSGNTYVGDTTHRIQKFNSSGAFVMMWGWGVQDGASALETCTSGCKVASSNGGPGNGQMGVIGHIAVDASGNVYVADYDYNRIDKFSSAGAFISTVGSGFGFGAGQLSNPWGVAVDASGSIYIGERGNVRISKFNSSGTFVTMWGWGVQDGASTFETCSSSCRNGLSGSGDGQMSNPHAIAVDASGNVYEADYSTSRVQKFSSNGTFLFKVGGYGASGGGLFSSPSGVTVDPSGNFYVVDPDTSLIQVFSANGTYLSQFGSIGSGNGQLQTPLDIAIGPTGNLYVSENYGHRVQDFASSYESGSNGSTSSSRPYYSIFTGSTYNAVNVQNTYPLPAGVVFVTSSLPVGSRVDVIFSPISGVTGAANIGIRSVSNPSLVSWISIGTSGNVSVSSTLPLGAYLSQFGSQAGGNNPIDVAVDSSGNIYVLDGNKYVQKFNSSGLYLSQFGSAGTGAGQLNDPRAIAIDKSGNLYVNDDNRVEEFNSGGVFIKMFGWGVQDGTSTFQTCTSGCQVGISGSGNGQFWGTQDLAFDSSGNLYVGDSGNARLQKFSSSSVYLSQFGSYGPGSGQFGGDGPNGIAFDGSGNIYVADNNNMLIQKFSSSGVYLSQMGTYGSYGSGNGQFINPIDVAIDSSGYIYVLDSRNFRVQKFSSSGVYLAQFGSKGTGNGQFSDWPSSFVLDGNGNMYVVDSGYKRVEKFSLGQ